MIMILDSETKAVELPEHHGDELRLWLRLLTCTTLIEGEVRSRLRERFDVTLPRFDLMAQLDKVPEGMTLSDVSKRMMVSNGNVTGLVERLVESGHLDRRTSDADRRVQVIRLTKAGRAEFRKMAAEHELWIADVFGDLTPKDVRESDAAAGQDQGLGAEIREGAGGLRLGAPATMRSSTTTGRGCPSPESHRAARVDREWWRFTNLRQRPQRSIWSRHLRKAITANGTVTVARAGIVLRSWSALPKAVTPFPPLPVETNSETPGLLRLPAATFIRRPPRRSSSPGAATDWRCLISSSTAICGASA